MTTLKTTALLLAVLLLGYVGVSIAQNSPGGAFLTNYDYILDTPSGWLWRTRTPMRIEGATDDAFETTITFDEPTADTTLSIPDGAGVSVAMMLSTLTTNDAESANSVWGVSNGVRFEGATADASETTITLTDPTADRTITIPNATGTTVLANAATAAGVRAGTLNLDGSNPSSVATGLSVIAACGVHAITSSSEPPGDRYVTFTLITTATAGQLDVWAWNTNGSDPTLQASTAAGDLISYLCVGTP